MEELQNEEIVEENTEDRRWCVYMHVCKANNKKYIGVTNNIRNRWKNNGKGYFRKKKDGTFEQPVFVRALNKYKDWDYDWDHIVVKDYLTQTEALQLESELIALHKTNCNRYKNPTYGYNMTDGGEGVKGMVYSEETKQKMSRSAKKRCTDEWKKNMSEKNKGKKKTAEFAERRRTIMSRPVVQLSLNGEYVSEYESARQACVNTGIDESAIRKCCKWQLCTAGGFFWANKEEWDLNSQLVVQKKIKNHHTQVVQLTKDGSFVAKYESQNDASMQTGIPANKIISCCHHQQKSAGGYVWIKLDEYHHSYQFILPKPQRRKVVQLSLDGEFVKEYPSVADADRWTNINQSSIVKCCKGKVDTAGGFYWMYKEDYEKQLKNLNNND